MAAATDLPTVSTDGNIKWYTIKNVRGNAYAAFSGSGTQIKLNSTIEDESYLFYFTTGANGGYKIHSAVTSKLCAGHSSWTADGINWYLRANSNVNYPGVSISHTSEFSDGSNWNDYQNKHNLVAYYDANDDGSAWAIEEYTGGIDALKASKLQMSTNGQKRFYYIKNRRANKYANFVGFNSRFTLTSASTAGSYWYFVDASADLPVGTEVPVGYVACRIYNAGHNLAVENTSGYMSENDDPQWPAKIYFIGKHDNTYWDYVIYPYNETNAGWNNQNGQGKYVANHSYDDFGSIWSIELTGKSESDLINEAGTAKNNALSLISAAEGVLTESNYYCFPADAVATAKVAVKDLDVTTDLITAVSSNIAIESAMNTLNSTKSAGPAVGDYIRFKNRAKGVYMAATVGDNDMIRKSNDKTDLKTLWLVEAGDDGGVKLKNVATQKYIGAISKSDDVKQKESADASQFTFENVADVYGTFKIKGGDTYTYANLNEWDGVFKVVGWEKNGNASQWMISEAYPLTVVYQYEDAEVEELRVDTYVDAGSVYTIENSAEHEGKVIASCKIGENAVDAVDGAWPVTVNGATTIVVTLEADNREDTDLYALKSPTGTYFNFTAVVPEPGAATTYASFQDEPSFVYKKSDVNGIYFQSLEDESKYIGYQTTGTYWITTTSQSYWTISEVDGLVELRRIQNVKGEDTVVRLGHDGNTNVGTGIFTNVGGDCNKWQLIPAYPVTVIYMYNGNEIDRVKAGVFVGESYTIDTKGQNVLSHQIDKGEIVVTDGVYSIPAVNGATEVTITLGEFDKYATSMPEFTDESGTIKSNNQFLTALAVDDTTIFTGGTAPTSAAEMYVLLPEDMIALTRGEHTFTTTFPDNKTSHILSANLWLDKDGDGTFETHLGTTGAADSNSNDLSTVSFTIPNDAVLGSTRLRFRLDSSWGIAATADATANRMVYDIPIVIVDQVETKELTYNFMYNDQKIGEQAITGTVGTKLPVPTQQFKVANELLSFVLPEGKVEEGTDTYNVEVRINNAKFPTPTTITDGQFANDTKWYFATLRNEYMQYNGSTEVVTTAVHGLTDKNLFTVVGNPIDGYHIYNKALGATKAIYSNTPNEFNSAVELNDNPNGSWYVTTNSNGGFSFYNVNNSKNHYLHEKNDRLMHWSSESAKTDGGSNLIFEPAYEFTVLIGDVPGSVDAEAKYRGVTALTNNGKLLLPRADLDLFTAKDISGYTWAYIVDESAKTISLAYTTAATEENPSAVVQLLARVGTWDVVDKFKFVLDPSINSKQETFVIGSEGDKILIKGSTLSALTMGLGWYLNNIAHINIAWNSLNEKTVSGAPYADLSDLPVPTGEETHSADAKYRYYLNTCTFGYSMTSWTWKRWQQEIDWMALHGINMPLQLVGLEEVWRTFLTMEDGNGKRKYGYTDEAAKAFVAGPAFIAWWAMNNLEGWGGTAAGSKSGYDNLAGAGGVQDDAWYARQKELAGKIVSAQRALGMQPVLPGWSGMVPTNFATKSGYATRGNGGNWAGDFVRPLLLSVNNANYADIAADYYACLEEVMGESQYYSMDPFHEGGGAGTMADYEALYAAMETAKPGSQWVIQQWQWSDTQKYSLTAVPAGKLVVLDLFSDGSPAFDGYNGYAPQDAVFCAIPNFGGRSGLMGRLQNVTDNYFKFKGKYSSIKGIGTAPEAIEQTPVTYDLIYQLPWMGSKPDVAAWVDNYAYARYGKNNSIVKEAWSLLRQGPLNYGADGIQGPVEDVWAARPNLSANPASFWGKTMNNAIGTYNKDRHQMLIDAVYKLIDQEDELALTDGSVYKSNYLYDLVEFGGAVMADYAYYLLKGIADAKGSDDALYQARKNAFLQLILDMDAFRGTNLNFRLGKWTQEARDAADEVEGATTATPDWYEYNNARTILTTWSSPGTNLNDYSYRSWQGLLKDFYYKRWKHYFDNDCTNGEYKYFEWNWAHGKVHEVGQTDFSNVDLTAEQDGHTSKYTREPEGNTIEEANEMLGKYIIPVVKADGSVYYAYRYLTNDEMASKVAIMATAGGALNLTEIFKVDLTGATVSGDFATMVTDNTFADFSNVVVKSDATTGSHAGVITLTDGTVLKFNVVLAKYNGTYRIKFNEYPVFVEYNESQNQSRDGIGYKLITPSASVKASAVLDEIFTLTPSGTGFTISAQGKYLQQPNHSTWTHLMLSDNPADAGVYIFEEVDDLVKIRHIQDGKPYVNDYGKVFGNDALKSGISTFKLEEVTSFDVTFADTLATINFPLNVVMPEGMTAYDITSDKLNYGSGSASAYAVLQPIATVGEVLKAGTPAVVKMVAGTYTFQIRMNSNGAKTSLDGSILKGNFVKETLTTSNEHNKFVLEADKFTAIEANTDIAANNCWVQTDVDVQNIVLSNPNVADETENNIVAIDDWLFKYSDATNGIKLIDAKVVGGGELEIENQYTINGKTQKVVAISPDFLHDNTDLTSITLPASLTNLGFREVEPMFKGSYKGQAGDGATYNGSTLVGEAIGLNRELPFPIDPDTDPQKSYEVNGNFAWRLTLDVTIDPTKKTSYNNFGSAIVSSQSNSLADYYNGYMQIYLWQDLQHIVVKVDNNDDRYSYSLPELDQNGEETGNLVTLNHFKFELEHDGAGGYQVVIYYDDGRAKMYTISAGQGNLNPFSSLWYSLPEGISVDVTFEKLISQGLFVGCTKLTEIIVDENNPTFKSCDHGVLYDKNGYYVMRIPEGGTDHYEIPSKVVKLYAGSIHGVNADIVLHSNPQIGVVKDHEEHVKNAKFYLSLDDIDGTIKNGETGHGGARDFISTNINTYQSARYKRAPLAEGKMGTIMLPFAPENALDKYDFFKLIGGEEKCLVFSQVAKLEPNTPYLYRLKETPGEMDFEEIEGKKTYDVFEASGFTVTTHAKYDPQDEKPGSYRALGALVNFYIDTNTNKTENSIYYYLSATSGKFHRVTERLNYRPYRAYFVVTPENPNQVAAAPARLSLRLLDGTTTDIDASLVEGMEAPEYYDLSGRRVLNPGSGVYIVNGKKVLIK